jgi:hypothetical protein
LGVEDQPRQISFNGALQAMTAFQDALRRAAPKDQERLMHEKIEDLDPEILLEGSV